MTSFVLMFSANFASAQIQFLLGNWVVGIVNLAVCVLAVKTQELVAYN